MSWSIAPLYAAAFAALAALAAGPAALAQPSTVDLYVATSGALGGDGSLADPYRRITDAVERVRTDRGSGAILPGDAIQIHVGPGSYVGSFDAIELASHPEYEVLPIILDQPLVTLSGSTVLARDARGLPTAAVPGTETFVEADAALAGDQFLILVTRTAGGSVGDDVTVEGLALDGRGGHEPSAGVYADRVTRFRVRDNWIQGAAAGVLTRMASGVIEGNLLSDNSELGTLVTGGSPAHPATVLIEANRSVRNTHGFGHSIGGYVRVQPDPGQNTVPLLEPLQITYDRDVPGDLENLPDTLDVTLAGNDASDNSQIGIRLAGIFPPHDYATASTSQPHTSVLNATVTGNTIERNGDFGIVLEAGRTYRSDPRAFNQTLTLDVEGNVVADNGKAPGLASFDYWIIREYAGYTRDWKFVEDSTYALNDPDGNLANFHYYHPAADLGGVTLNNTLLLNGVVVPNGVRGLPACSDLLDDDGDGLVDLADPGCPRSVDGVLGAITESPECDDGLDNDGNGLVDFDDPKCTRSWPFWEKPPPLSCGLGAELALLLPLLGAGRRLGTRPGRTEGSARETQGSSHFSSLSA